MAAGRRPSPAVAPPPAGQDRTGGDQNGTGGESPSQHGDRRELTARLAADRDAIIAALLGSVDPGPVMAIGPGQAGPHPAGPQPVTARRPGHWVATFADGRRLVYRPASLSGHAWLGRVLDWLEQRIPQAGLRYAAVLPRPGYGWVEFIEHQAPGTAAAADRYSRCYGTLLAAAYALDAQGLQARHLVANGDCPVVVNGEAALRAGPLGTGPPVVVSAPDPAAAMLASSVHRLGLLQGLNREPQGNLVLEPAVLAGFRLGYDAIVAHRGDLTRWLGETRSRQDRTRHTGGPQSGAFPSAALHLRAADAADAAARKVAGLSPVDRHDQEWIIAATLKPRAGHGETAPRAAHAALMTTRASAPSASAPSASASTASIAAEPARLLAVACGLADQIVARCVADGTGPYPGRVNWLGLQPAGRGEWAVQPMGADLAHGYLGVALYLAQLAGLTGVGRYAEVAGQALNGWPARAKTLADQPELLAAAGCGGYDGLGGISYGLARMSALLGDSRLSEWAAAAIGLAATAARPGGPAAGPGWAGWAKGNAGCLAAMLAVHSETGSPDAASLAETIARRLAELVEQTDGWCVPAGTPPRPGFACGPAGVGWALARFGAVHGQPSYLGAGRHAVRCAVSLADAVPGTAPGSAANRGGWYSGTAGLLAARCCLTDPASLGRLRADLLALGRRPAQRDLSLSHGELGLAEAISLAAATARSGAAASSLRWRAGLVLAALRRHPDYCGTPGGVSTPGLLHGLAGIGYGLLRLAFPGQVPRVLLLEPAPAPSSTAPSSPAAPPAALPAV